MQLGPHQPGESRHTRSTLAAGSPAVGNCREAAAAGNRLVKAAGNRLVKAAGNRSVKAAGNRSVKAAGNRSVKAAGNCREAAVAGNCREAAVDSLPTVVQAVAQSSAHSLAELNLLGTVPRTLPENAAKKGY
jgi:hypothetical protein